MKKFIVVFLLIIVLLGTISYHILLGKIDTLYAEKYNEIFGSYDIDEVDQYLNSKTLITYRGETKTYQKLRENVISAFEEKEYEMPNGSSYGHGNDQFVNGVQTVGIQSYIKSQSHTSDGLQMELEKSGFRFKVKSIQSDDEFFGYLFYGKKVQ